MADALLNLLLHHAMPIRMHGWQPGERKREGSM